MVDLAEALREMKVPPRKPAAKKIFTLRRLRRMAVWGATAAGALFVAVLASGNEVASQRLAGLLHHGRTPVSAQSFDAEAAARQLSEGLRQLAADDNQIKSRLAAVEQNMDDMTGSVSRQVEAAKAAARDAVEDNGPTVQATAAVVVSKAAPMLPQLAAVAPQASAAAAPQLSSGPEFGVDIGSALSIPALRARWLAIRSAHPQLLDGLQPVVNVREIAHSSRVELRLIAGPFDHAAAATQLCASLTAFGLYCQPTLFDGQHLALR
jgi:hypothetical protein